ncbi:MAG: hypothetical protein IPO64_13555 [Bacteroidetes bacterium]|jgi:hypothetical protein|nr:hypothetical protein [Bacteroidota bacterium]MBL0079994.1 hypothetical protein [Bacteroidota bacterium]
MKFTDYFRLKAIARFIRKNFSTHEVVRQPITLESAALIGIIFNASHYEEMLAAIEYSKKLDGFKKNIKLMGFVNEKKATSSFPFPFFTKSDLNWLKRPNCSQVDTFINVEFDILINLSTEVLPPLEFIAGASKAKFRIGLYTQTKLPHYDFLIQINENPSVEKLISNIENYLK